MSPTEPARTRSAGRVRRTATRRAAALLAGLALVVVTLALVTGGNPLSPEPEGGAEQTAAAGGTRVAIYMPFDNGGRTGLVRPADHTPRLLGGFSWDLHKGPGAAVKPQMKSFDGPVSLKVARVDSNNNGAGQMVTLDVRVGGTAVGQIRYGHLANLQVTTSTPAFPPGTTIGFLPTGKRDDSRCGDGTADGWPYSSSWRVCTESGIHTHTDFQKGCWAAFDTYAVLPADTPIAMMSTALPTASNARCDAAELAHVATDPVAEGDFVAYGGHTYRIAGGAPLHVSNWAAFGGAQPTETYDAAQWGTLRRYPVDDTWIRGLPSGRVFRIAGGAPVHVPDIAPDGPVVDVDDRAIDRVGTDHVYDHLRPAPLDGTFLVAARSGRTYVVAGGAPLFVSSLAPWGGTGAVKRVFVGERALDDAGGAGGFSFLRRTPVDGTFLIGRSTGGVFRVAGGSPQWVDSWAPYGGVQPTTAVDDAAIDRAGTGGEWDRMAAYPADGTVLRTVTDGRLYRVAGGAPLHLPTTAALEDPAQAPVDVAATVIDDAARADRNHAHLRATPADGTFVVVPTGGVSVFAGGAAFPVESWAPYGGPRPAVRIDRAALTNRGVAAQPWGGHVAAVPADGTFVRVLDGTVTGRVARAAGGGLIPLSSCDLVGCAPLTGVTGLAYDSYTATYARPADGAVLRFLPSGQTVQVDGDACLPARPGASVVEVNDRDYRCVSTVPDAPSGVAAVRGDRSATVTWTAPAGDGGEPLTGYVVVATPADGGAEVRARAAADATSVVVPGLTNGTTWTFRVAASNRIGDSEPSEASAGVVPAGPPAQVATPYSRATGDDVVVAWLPPDANGEPVTGYVVHRDGRAWAVPAELDRITFRDLPRGTYSFTVTATNAVGSSVPSEVRTQAVTVAPPSAVGMPAVTAKGRDVTVSWAMPATNGGAITGYVVQRGDKYWSVPATQRHLTYRGLAPGTYDFRVYSTNAAGNSPASPVRRVVVVP
ncbi:fibronectin type III domain-containing protein [Nocardioides sp. CPCC 205120]|uniref:fibronectin type III domain-containing protein n=1 Tax=Nocardioides sp. CPCC 205120 TaxID=3406462 RepID=UPI003B50488B